MPFKFLVTEVHDLPAAGKQVLDGQLLSGCILTGQCARVSDGGETTFLIEGVELGGSAKSGTNRMSLTVPRSQALAAGVRANLFIAGME